MSSSTRWTRPVGVTLTPHLEVAPCCRTAWRVCCVARVAREASSRAQHPFALQSLTRSWFKECSCILIVFPSSTSRDLPAERSAVLEACRALNLAVAAMEDFPATGSGATAGSLAQLAKCDVYIGVFARRYGYVEAESTSRSRKLNTTTPAARTRVLVLLSCRGHRLAGRPG